MEQAMPLNTSGKFSAVAAIAALTIATPPLIGTAAAQAFYAPSSEAMGVYPPPRAVEVYPPPGEAVEVNRPPHDTVEAYPPPREAIEANRPPRDAVNVPVQQISGTTTPVSAVSMRAGPGINNPVIGTLHAGMPLQLLATGNHGWMQVQSPVGTGWVYGSYLASGTGMPAPTNISASGPMPTSGTNPPTSANNQPPPEITSP
jgi:hypothetical protein